jgi:hypothetical protein
MTKYRKKPVVIEAVQWTGHNISDICKFTDRDVNHLIAGGQLYIATLEGVHRASVGDFIIKGVKGEFYPCKPDIFAQTYEPANGVTFATDTNDGCKWISVEDRLPVETYQVLTVDDTGWIEIDALGWEDWLSHRDVTHWMPLPELPKEANN